MFAAQQIGVVAGEDVIDQLEQAGVVATQLPLGVDGVVDAVRDGVVGVAVEETLRAFRLKKRRQRLVDQHGEVPS